MRILRLCAPLLSSLLSLSILPGLKAQTVPTFNVETYQGRAALHSKLTSTMMVFPTWSVVVIRGRSWGKVADEYRAPVDVIFGQLLGLFFK